MPAMRNIHLMSLRAALCCGLLLLAACAAERGDILDADPHDYTDASFLEVPDDEDFWLAPPPAGRHVVEPADQQVPKQGLWLKAGWFNVESQCFTPRKAQRQVSYPIFPEYADATPLYIQPGHHYLLMCDLYKVGKFDLVDTGWLKKP
ncbi:MAG: hypothetical protein ACHQAZ_04525 [Gammaproteobacteria bacterium]